MTDLFGVEKFPLFVMKLSVKLDNEFRMDEVEESVANIAIILENNRKSTL